jgi:hypothetical protein
VQEKVTNMSDEYTGDPTPGDWDHRSGDCEKHGVNVAHFRAKGYTGPYFCVACALAILDLASQTSQVEVPLLTVNDFPMHGKGSCGRGGCGRNDTIEVMCIECGALDAWLKANGA